MKLTEEQRIIVLTALESMYGDEEGKIFDTDTLKWKEFKESLLSDDDPGQIKALMSLCQDLQKEESFAEFGFIVMYDMWLNKSPIWPVPYNPMWKWWNLRDRLLKIKKLFSKFIMKIIKKFNCLLKVN